MSETSHTYTLTVKEDDLGELYVVLPDEMLDELGWDLNTELIYEINEDGSVMVLSKQNASKSGDGDERSE